MQIIISILAAGAAVLWVGTAHAQGMPSVSVQADTVIADGSFYSDPPFVREQGNDLRTYQASTGLTSPTGTAETSCTTSASMGRLRTASSQAAFDSVLGGSASCSTDASFSDFVVASAPGLAAGDAITYEIKAKFVASKPSTGKESISMCVGLGDSFQCSETSKPFKLKLRTTVGTVLQVRAQLGTSVRADSEQRSTAIASTKLVRVILASPTAGANLIGTSGYLYR
ncbi:MAG: hypothetical protein U5L74_14055 [Ideonella sp.]|nr:hypothetical protein [Ideonella sp.]